jgi:tyrosinase
MSKSPVFDGSEYSLGGDGEFVEGHRSGLGGTRAGTGGGCLKKGTPFANYTVNLGPAGRGSPLRYNPRCIKRDLNSDVCRRGASLRNTTRPILDSPDIETFQAVVQGDGRVAAARGVGTGVHGGGHFCIGGDPGGDFYWSPLEPGFYLHHGNIDRMHFIWQNLDWENRQVRTTSPPSPGARA